MLALAITHRRRTSTGRDAAYYARAEHQACAELVLAGAVKLFLKRTDGRGAVMILEAATETELRRMLEGLPLVDAGICAYRLVGIEPFTGFEPRARGELVASEDATYRGLPVQAGEHGVPIDG